MPVQNKKTCIEDVQDVIDEVIVNTVHEIFKAALYFNPVSDLFNDLSKLLIEELYSQSLMEFNLALKDDQKEALKRAVSAKGNMVVNNYLANLDNDKRTREIYLICKEHAGEIADRVLSSIGQEVNRGAIINAVAVQANAKNEEHNEILLRTEKGTGDITIPTNCILISTNCVSIIKSSCKEEPADALVGLEHAGESATT